jgi:hypothetical protein
MSKKGLSAVGWVAKPGEFKIVNALGYPQVMKLATAAAETLRNNKNLDGHAIKPTKTGFKARFSGRYQVSFTVPVLVSSPLELNVFVLVNHKNGTPLDPLHLKNLLDDSNSVAGGVTTFKGIGPLTLRKGDRVALWINNGVGSLSVPVNISGWELTAQFVN